MKDFFDNFEWHSSIGFENDAADTEKHKKKIANTKEAKAGFITAGKNLLIHKATNALWKFSDDKKSIVPVFDTDILTEDDLKSME